MTDHTARMILANLGILLLRDADREADVRRMLELARRMAELAQRELTRSNDDRH